MTRSRRPFERGDGELSERELDVLWLYGHDGMPIKIVADVLGISTETGKSYLKRIRQKLWARGLSNHETTRTHLYLLALSECVGRPECRAARDDLLRALLADGAPERMSA